MALKSWFDFGVDPGWAVGPESLEDLLTLEKSVFQVFLHNPATDVRKTMAEVGAVKGPLAFTFTLKSVLPLKGEVVCWPTILHKIILDRFC